MPFSRLAETRIREAMSQGEFDNRSNAGQALDLEGCFSAPAAPGEVTRRWPDPDPR